MFDPLEPRRHATLAGDEGGGEGSGALDEGPLNATTPRVSAETRFAATVFCAWLICGSILSGVVNTLQAGHALQAFGAVDRIPDIMAVAIPRVSAPHLAGVSAGVAFVVWTDRGGPSAPVGRWRARLWLPLTTIPLAAVLAAPIVLFASFVTAARVFGITRAAFVAGVKQAALIDDLEHGLVKAGSYALVLGVAAALVGPALARVKARLRWKIPLTVLAISVAMGLVDLGLDR
jgi:hypothetical protein